MDAAEIPIDTASGRARSAQRAWAQRPVAARLRILRALRRLVAARAAEMIAAIGERYGRDPAETLAAELIPFADACRYLEGAAARLLRVRRLGMRGRPLWLAGARAEVRRAPLGVVLILAPGNYRLLLAGVQAIQALVAGNAVLVKPAPGAAEPMRLLGEWLAEAGLPEGLFVLLGEDVAAAKAAVAAGVDKVILTGAPATGRAVLADLAPRLTPAALELSGNDAVFVLEGADLDLVARALAWGIGLNGGATCIAPRRVFGSPQAMAGLATRLAPLIAAMPAVPVDAPRLDDAAAMIDEAVAAGGRLIGPAPVAGTRAMHPVVVTGAAPGMRLLVEDPFAPLACLVAAADTEAALAMADRSPYGLGAAIFGPEAAARDLVPRLRAGVVTINDLIAPTADPRLPFGGRGESGYGVTRGAEGLLEMTAPLAVVARSGRARPHYGPRRPEDAAMLEAFLRLMHGRGRARALGDLLRAIRRRAQ